METALLTWLLPLPHAEMYRVLREVEMQAALLHLHKLRVGIHCKELASETYITCVTNPDIPRGRKLYHVLQLELPSRSMYNA